MGLMDILFGYSRPVARRRKSVEALSAYSIKDPHSTLVDDALVAPTLTQKLPARPPISVVADRVVFELRRARDRGPTLDDRLCRLVRDSGGFFKPLALEILEKLYRSLEAGEPLGPAAQGTYEQAKLAACVFEGYEPDRPIAIPVAATVLAMGILMVMAPYILDNLGFQDRRVNEGMLSCRSTQTTSSS